MRTKGARDSRPRKKRKFYGGKRIKRTRKYGNFVRYVSTRKRDDPIKLYIWGETPMDKESYMRFSEKTRRHMKRVVYGKGAMRMRIDVDPYQISSKERVEELCESLLWDGVWLFMTFSHGKTRTHVKPVKLCKVRVTDHPEGLKAKMIRNYRLFRYWFWEK